MRTVLTIAENSQGQLEAHLGADRRVLFRSGVPVSVLLPIRHPVARREFSSQPPSGLDGS
jgi:hypothetical protein